MTVATRTRTGPPRELVQGQQQPQDWPPEPVSVEGRRQAVAEVICRRGGQLVIVDGQLRLCREVIDFLEFSQGCASVQLVGRVLSLDGGLVRFWVCTADDRFRS